jgi:hypothetical protein
VPGRRRALIPALPLPKRALPWILFFLGLLSIAYGSIAGDLAGLSIGVIAVGGALLSWTAEWLLGSVPPQNEDEDETDA